MMRWVDARAYVARRWVFAANQTATSRSPRNQFRKRYIGLATIAAVAASLAASSSSVASPMELSGKLDVSSTGGATYHVPVAVPPGTAGMVPNLSIDYDSQSGDGIAGVGWSLSGLSAIRRCPTTMAQDGAAGRIGYDANDRFCLDGSRLVPTSGTNGADGTVYGTEVESFVKVISHGTAGSGPSWFEVHLPNGQTLEFGNTTDSKVLALGTSTVRVWALDKVTDTKGNYYSVTYNNDTTNGSYYPTEIDYTGNAAAGVSPYASVQFSYAARPTTDQVPAYVAGSMIKLTQELTDIKTFTGTSQVLDYKLAYETAANVATGRARLASIQMCDGASNCQPATSFTWSNPAASTLSFNAATNWWSGPGTYTSFGNDGLEDINGDGMVDAIGTNNGALYYAPSTGTAFSPQTAMGVTAYAPQLVDLYGHGRSDLVALNASNQLVAYLNNGSGTLSTTPTASLMAIGVTHPVVADIYTPQFADLNGDGLPDMVWHNTTNAFYYALNTGSGFGSSHAITGPSDDRGTISLNTVNSTVSTLFANLTGRGKVDLIFTFNSIVTNGPCTRDGCSGNTTSTNTGPWEVWYATWNGSGFNAPVKAYSAIFYYGCAQQGSNCVTANPAIHTYLGDANGDGLSDLFLSVDNYTNATNTKVIGAKTLIESNGNGLNAGVGQSISPDICNYGMQFYDVYGSGRTDAVCMGGSNIVVSRPSGVTYGAWATLAAPVGTIWYMKDLNGDGMLDLLMEDGNRRYWVDVSNGYNGLPPDLLTTVTTGLGATATISYDEPAHKPTTSGSTIYTKGTDASYPAVNLQPAAAVVTQIDRSNGIGGNLTTTYTYNNAQTYLNGRGFMGFADVTATDQQTGVATDSSYKLGFPFTGAVAAQLQKHAGIVLSEQDNTYAFNTITGGSISRYFPYLTQSVKQGADLDGSALPSVTTSYQYDGYGNPTQVSSQTSDGFIKTVTNTYTPDTSHWILNLLTQSQTSSTTP